MAAIIGFERQRMSIGNSSTRDGPGVPSPPLVPPPAATCLAKKSISAPAQKPRPAPVSTATRTDRSARLRLACDSLVALGAATADGAVLFAKNSDRPANECQPLVQLPRQSHAPGSRLRCTYIEIPQAAETARLIGSRPFWCWGF